MHENEDDLWTMSVNHYKTLASAHGWKYVGLSCDVLEEHILQPGEPMPNDVNVVKTGVDSYVVRSPSLECSKTVKGNIVEYDESIPDVNTATTNWLDEKGQIQQLPYVKVLQPRALAFPTMKSVRVLMRHLAQVAGIRVTDVTAADVQVFYHFASYGEVAQEYVAEVHAL